MGTVTTNRPLRLRWPDGRKVVREARSYARYFAGPCSWCDRPLGDRPTVDHDHACCAPQNGKCCAECVRGLVHLSCNHEIAWIEQLQARGYTIVLSDRQRAYFEQRPVALLFS